MASIGDIWLGLRGDGSPLLKDAKTEGAKAGDVAGQSFTGRMKAQLKKAFSGGEFGKGLVQGLGLAGAFGAANLASNAVSKLTDVLQDSVKAASDQREAIALTDQVFEDSAGTIEDWSKTTAKSMGESKTSAMNLASGVATSLAATGESMDVIAKKSIELVERAADVGSAYNATGEEVATAFKSALQGESEPARRFGVLLSENAVKAEAYASGIAEVGDELTEAQKVTARYNIILKQTSKSAGMFGRDVDSAADKAKIMAARAEDLSAKLGSVLLPKVVELQEGVLGVADALDVVTENAGPFEGALTTAFDAASSGLRPDKVIAFGQEVKTTVDGIVYDLTHMQSESEMAAQGIETAWEDGRGAMQKAASGAAGAARSVDDSADDIVESWSDMIDRLTTEADRLISDVYDPGIQRDKLAAVEAEMAAEAKIQAAQDATAGEIAASQERVRVLAQDAAQLRLDLLESGNLTADETKAWLTTLQRKYNSATGAARQDIADLIAKIKELSRVRAVGIDVSVRGGIVGGKKFGDETHRAEGGPMRAGQMYEVGERGREWVVPGVDSFVLPNEVVRAVESGGATAVPAVGHLEIYGLPLQAETPLEVVRELQRATHLSTTPRLSQPQGFRR